MTFQITSDGFHQGAAIPKKYTGDGQDISPPLKWSAPPAGTQSFALICDDPDAPRRTYIHWVLYNIPANTHELPEGVKTTHNVPTGAVHGTNDFQQLDYGGPAPPPGKPHRYYFKLYALDRHLELPQGATKAQLLTAMQGHELGECELMGNYGRTI